LNPAFLLALEVDRRRPAVGREPLVPGPQAGIGPVAVGAVLDSPPRLFPRWPHYAVAV